MQHPGGSGPHCAEEVEEEKEKEHIAVEEAHLGTLEGKLPSWLLIVGYAVEKSSDSLPNVANA